MKSKKNEITIIKAVKFPIKEQIEEWDAQKKHFLHTSTAHSDIIDLYHRGKVNTRYIVSRSFNKGTLPTYNRMKPVVERSGVVIKKHKDPTFHRIDKSVRKKNIEFNYDTAINIDITKAYATCLINNKFIDAETYRHLNNLPKVMRLKSVGMLATAKTKTLHKNGGIVGVPEFKQNKYLSSVFYFIQYEIGRIMNIIARHYSKKGQFIFFWVDGIYLTPDADPTFAYETFKRFNYKFETIHLSDFSVRREMGRFYPLLKINFKKGTGKRAEPKYFTIPLCKINREW